jgi:hypothetical protein
MRRPAVLATFPLAASLTAATLLTGSLPASQASTSIGFHRDVQVTTQKPAGWDEPSGIAGTTGGLYVAAQNPELSGNPGSPDITLAGSSTGQSWSTTGYYNYEKTRAEGTLGDVTMAASDGTIFVGHLTGTVQAEIDWSRDGGKTWHTSNDIGPLPSPGGASNSPSLVDRPWIAAYSPNGNYLDTTVYLEFHDFSTSAVYVVTCSMATGSLVCGLPIPVSNPQTGCNSIPGGIAVSPPGSRHPGRVYAVWTTADPQTNVLSGCNYTQLAPFYSLYVAWSDTPAAPGSWTQVPVYIGPHGPKQDCPKTAPVEGVSTDTCADMSELFSPVAVDRAGNVYVAFVDYIGPVGRSAYNVYLARSTDGGTTWDGRTNGSGPPALASNPGGTHYTPNLVAGSAGRVAVIYYATGYTDEPYNADDTCPTTVPPETSCQGKNEPEPPGTAWVTDVAVSLDATASHPSFSRYRVSDSGVVVHYGDICNLGIYCDGSSTGNRSLFENNTVFTAPNGCLVTAWTDQRLDPHAKADAASSNAQAKQEAYDEIFSSRQVSGPSLFAGHTCG